MTAFSTASVPALKKARALGTGDGHERTEPLGELDVALVRHDGEIGVNEALALLLDRLEHPRMTVADVHHTHPAGEVDEAIAVDVGDRHAFGLGRKDRQMDDQRMGDRLELAREELTRARAWKLGANVDRLGRRHDPAM